VKVRKLDETRGDHPNGGEGKRTLQWIILTTEARQEKKSIAKQGRTSLWNEPTEFT
jgi:hypothetical protein